jgi:WASH complex subunit 7
MYPYERANKFVKDIRKLGVNEGWSFLDQFRMLITKIGNALGYVRMVRSASMHYCSEAVKFLPELDDTISFEHYSKSGLSLIFEGAEVEAVNADGSSATFLSPETIQAGKNLDEVIRTLIKNFGEASDFFKLLVNIFQETLNTDTHDHLKYFYCIVPALCISWIDASLQAKDAMFKIVRGASAREMYFTDDGFAMGIAYCLAILKQTKKFESLNWQESVRTYQIKEMNKIQEQQKIRYFFKFIHRK